jgi:hypothetical protein
MPDTEQRGQQDMQGQPERQGSSNAEFRQDASENRSQSSDGRTENDREGQRSSGRGFAAMNRERQKEIASEGGRAAHRQGVAHEWSREEAREAGRKGGQSVSRNREHMSEIGRKGGQRSGRRRSSNENQ